MYLAALVTAVSMWVFIPPQQPPPTLIVNLRAPQHVHQVACYTPKDMRHFGAAEMLGSQPGVIETALLLTGKCVFADFDGYVTGTGSKVSTLMGKRELARVSLSDDGKPVLFILVRAPSGPKI